MQPSQNDCAILPSAISTTSASSKWSFRGSIAAAYTLAVYASQWRLPHTHHARLASGRWLVPLPGGVDVRLPAAPPGPIRRVSVTMLLHHASPLPGLSLAQQDQTLDRRFVRRLRKLDKLSAHEKKLLLGTIDAFLSKVS